MTLVRERRHQRALRLSLPAADFRNSLPFTPETSPISPDIESLSDLKKLAVLGIGNGGIVYKVSHQKTNSIYALKLLRLDQNGAFISHQAVREAEILKRVDSQFIVKCHAVFYTLEGGLCFLMKHMEGGSLFDVLRVRGNFPEDVISGIALSVLKALQYLHGMRIIHGDIKPSNLLINGKGEVKIADFGVSRIVEGTPTPCEACMGAYMSPERVDSERWGGGADYDYYDYGFAGDVWSLGVVVLECLVGHYPLIGRGEKPDLVALICAICFGETLEMPETASPEFPSFVKNCLEKDWRKRGSVEELLAHPFVNRTTSSNMII
ncbi:putative Mitogen-activated protein kinase kinase 5 [Melia azedarach]|uniref:Mitogen-activated protein kinase kinase 5 n=1 Tax=Melia azedarach TaxID=155640 RepID=A0ACC1X6P6_MELAZ|nr:putative Mitogen-activated protein kinase kinase 5 [Melia azedarach]